VAALALDHQRGTEIDEVTDRVLRRHHTGTRAGVRARVRRQFDTLDDAPVRQFVPVFVERRVRAELGE